MSNVKQLQKRKADKEPEKVESKKEKKDPSIIGNTEIKHIMINNVNIPLNNRISEVTLPDKNNMCSHIMFPLQKVRIPWTAYGHKIMFSLHDIQGFCAYFGQDKYISNEISYEIVKGSVILKFNFCKEESDVVLQFIQIYEEVTFHL